MPKELIFFMQEVLRCCNRRMLLINNRTASEAERENQVTDLLKIIDNIITDNGGLPYSNELFRKARAISRESRNDKEKAYAKQLRQFKDMMEPNQPGLCSELEEKLRIGTQTFQEHFSLSAVARKQTEEVVSTAQQESAKEIRKLEEQFLWSARKQAEEVLSAQQEVAQDIRRLLEELERDRMERENQKRQGRCCTIM
ncbi:hypothetical protein KI387_002503 [Taxus chinensis]|uniref:AIG1-type G domain-containing protein n=1 Tax=Taxus chinensis TaxID=29808 RepID=A0AA38LPY3_TAXCH|nr:hypothetical protein KI387_002503 [Taxus chinensis]